MYVIANIDTAELRIFRVFPAYSEIQKNFYS